MAGKPKTKAQGARQPAEPEDVQPRQPAWRQEPAKPRKKVKQQTFAAQQSRGTGSVRKGAPVRIFVMPTRAAFVGFLRAAALVLAVAGAATGLLYLLRWPALTVGPGSTLIGGAQRIDPSVIYEKSDVAGRNILVLRAADVQSRLQQVPGVAEADVHLRLPNQVIIDVVEHSPLVAWQAISDTLWLAADGSVVPQSGARPPLQLVDQSGGRLTSDSKLKTLILDNLTTLREASPDINELYYGNSQGLYYRTPEGWDVWLGESGGMREKVALASAAGRDIARSGARPKVIDVRHSDRKAMWW